MLEEKQTRKNYYRVLGVERDATPEEIKKAFRRLAFLHHPDRSSADGAEERFKEVNEAYQVLSDAERRACYDSLGQVDVGRVFGRGFEGFNAGGLGDIFDTFFGGTPGGNRAPERGADVRVELAVTFEEAVFGCSREIEANRMEMCAGCKGTGCQPGTAPQKCANCGGFGRLQRSEKSVFGRFVNMVPCDRCHGEGTVVVQRCSACSGIGRVRRGRKLIVVVPPGVCEGSQLRLSGEGDVGLLGGPQGDLLVSLAISPHHLFKREKADIIFELKLNFAQAALGDRLEVPTLDGGVCVQVPAGSQTGDIIRVRGRGVPLPDGRRGDHLARLRVVTPTGLDERQKKLLEELKESLAQPDAKE